MEEKFQLAISDLLEKSIRAMEAGGEFLGEQIPDVVYQLLLWHGVKSAMYCVIGILLVGFIVWINKKQFNSIKEQKEEDESWGEYLSDLPILMCNMFQAFWIFPLVILINIEWLQIWLTPKVWLIEYGAKLIK